LKLNYKLILKGDKIMNIIKKIGKMALCSVALIGMTGASVAFAETYEVNLYGASAQYILWSSAAEDFLKSDAVGCASISKYDDTAGKNYVGECTKDGNTYRVRVSAKTSTDGILAVTGHRDLSVDSSSSNYCADGKERKMLDTAATHTMTCEDVTIGAADVEYTSLTQHTYGAKYGPKTGQTATERNYQFDAPDVLSVATEISSFDHVQPFIVPFAFFVNKTVTDTNGNTIDNLSRLQVNALFSGKIKNWAALGLQNRDVRLCLRHAGSGTHATLDLGVFRGDASLASKENNSGSVYGYSAAKPIIWFNDGSSDLMKCLNGTYTTETGAGAVGYADADQSTSSYSNVARLKFQGIAPSKLAILNAGYDFWSLQNLYINPEDEIGLNASFIEYATNLETIPSTLGVSTYWATAIELNNAQIEKGADDVYPEVTGVPRTE
jgi:hypothetical protein